MKTYEQKFWLVVDAISEADAEQAITEIASSIDRGIVFLHANEDEDGERAWSLTSDGPVEFVEDSDENDVPEYPLADEVYEIRGFADDPQAPDPYDEAQERGNDV